MNRDAWDVIKRSKNFNVNIYRRGIVALIISLMVSFISGFVLFYVYLMEPERDFYATNGVAPPIKLQPLFTPNYSTNALLPPDPPTEQEEKLIPQ